MRRTAALIAGGGPAGAAAAIRLGAGGVRALLIERSAGPHDVVCGGFLGWDALAALDRLGVDVATLGAMPIDRVRIVTARRTIETRLPAPAAGLSRRTLDAALLALAGERAEVVRGVAIRSAEGCSLALADGTGVTGDALFLATGKHELRGVARAIDGVERSIGLRVALPADPGLAGVIELHPFDSGYAGLLLQEDGRTNLCLSASKARLAEAGGDPRGLPRLLAREAPALADRLADAPADWVTIAGVPYGWRTQDTARGVFRLGDQAAVIASLAGDGVAIALTSGIAAADAYLADGPGGANAYQRRFAAQAAPPLRAAGIARGLAERGWARRPAMAALALFPGLARIAARASRIDAAGH